jgi:hypothetical protein
MPRRNDIAKVLLMSSAPGPSSLGQSAEFDYSGTQACKALKSEGYEVVLANSNPATIMTDPEIADRTYIEPLTRDVSGRDHPHRAENWRRAEIPASLPACRRWAGRRR